MSHYKPYPAYKNSGVEWIGPVPEHWRIAPIKALAQVINGATPDSGNPDYWDGDIAWFTPADLDNENATELSEPRRKITAIGLASCAARLTRAGSVVLSTRAPVGSVGVTQTPSATNQGCRTLVPAVGIPSNFLAETLVAARAELSLRSNGTTFQELSTDSLASLRVPLPPPTEQSAISAALDRETARIDALIEKKTRFIDLLKEKRQALITHTVTKGLDPNVKMKDSGVEWIGEVPEHWNILSTKRLFHERDERSATGTEELLTVSHLTGVTPRSEKTVYMFEAETTEGYKICHVGDLVINTLWAWMGAMGTCRQAGIVSPAYNVYAPLPTLVPELVDLIARMPVFAAEVTRYSKGVWTSRLRLYPEGFFEVRFAVPPLKEQEVIVNRVLRKTQRIDALIDTTERSIALLTERRSALITAAVTGQIDLRDASSSESESNPCRT
jgi:type I restriction enzyme S subunit